MQKIIKYLKVYSLWPMANASRNENNEIQQEKDMKNLRKSVIGRRIGFLSCDFRLVIIATYLAFAITTFKIDAQFFADN